MNDWTKTGLFVATALGICVACFGTHFATQPKVAPTENLVGKPLFESLEAEQVKSLEVVARDPVTQTLRRFKVENRDGVWRIPSHHNYPAEAAKRLFETATALYGVERLALNGQWTEDQSRFGVVAPDSEAADSADVEAIGQRVILRDGSDEILADLIVGKPADNDVSHSRDDAFDPAKQKRKRFNVRRGDETATYVANLNINLSTRFADWIEPDLLQVDQPEINKLVIDNYELQIRDELTNRGTVRRIGKLDKDRHVLTREKAFDPWNLDGLNAEKEELNNETLSKILDLLDEMAIVGVRPKVQLEGKPLLNADLSINTDFETYRTDPAKFQEAILDLQSELMEYGFNVVPGNEQGEKATFYSNRGEFYVSTNQGIAYNLYFGDSVLGSDEEIEIGGPKVALAGEKPTTEGSTETSPSADANEKEVAASSNPPDPTKTDPSKPTKKNRYLMVRVTFDPAALGPEPVEPKKPEEPVKPEGYVAAPTPAEPAPPATPDAAPTPPVDNRDPAFIKYDEQIAEHKLAQQKFEMDLDQFKRDSEDYKNRRQEGERASKRLGDRFGAWFYVIAAEDLESLQIPRTDLVRPKATDALENGEIPPAPIELPMRPDISM